MLSAVGVSDTYVWRASYLPTLNVTSRFVYDPDQNFDILRFGMAEWKQVAPYLLKEFYPLTPWRKDTETTEHTAYSFFDPEREEGVLLAFRQESCVRPYAEFRLPYIVQGEKYTVTDQDTGETWEIDGNVTLRFDGPRTAKLLWVKKA